MPGPSGDVCTTTSTAAGIFFGTLFSSVRRALIPPAEAPMTMTLLEFCEGTLNALTLQPNSRPPQNILRSSREGGRDAGRKNDAAGYRHNTAMVNEQLAGLIAA